MKRRCRPILIGLLGAVWMVVVTAGVMAATDEGASPGSTATGEDVPDDETAGGGSHGSTNPIAVGPDLAIFTGIIFLLLLMILSKFAWGPISEALQNREEGLLTQLEEAKRSNEEAQRLLAEHQSQLDGAADEVRSLIEQAKREAETQKDGILAEAQAAAKSEKDRAVREIDAAKNLALKDLAEKSVDTAVGLAGRIVRKQLSADDHAQLIQDALGQFPSEN